MQINEILQGMSAHLHVPVLKQVSSNEKGVLHSSLTQITKDEQICQTEKRIGEMSRGCARVDSWTVSESACLVLMYTIPTSEIGQGQIWPYQISQNQRANAEIAYNLEKTDLERERENYSAKEPYSASFYSTLDKKGFKMSQKGESFVPIHNTILLQTSPDNLCKYEICMSFIKFSY